VRRLTGHLKHLPIGEKLQAEVRERVTGARQSIVEEMRVAISRAQQQAEEEYRRAALLEQTAVETHQRARNATASALQALAVAIQNAATPRERIVPSAQSSAIR
jgi:hypothetical protein